MLSIGVQEKHIAGSLQETFVSAPVPRHPLSQQMLKSWHKKPADGFLIGRDIPAEDPENPCSHVLVWQPADNGQDFIARINGTALARTFGDSVVGRRMSELLSPELFAYQRHVSRQLLSESRIETLDICQSHNGFAYLHYEMVLFSARTAENAVWLATGIFYF